MDGNGSVSRLESRIICWKLAFRGFYGESLLHILIICNTSVHTIIAKLLINKYPSLVHDIFETDEYYGEKTYMSSIYAVVVFFLDQSKDSNQDFVHK